MTTTRIQARCRACNEPLPKSPVVQESPYLGYLACPKHQTRGMEFVCRDCGEDHLACACKGGES